MLNPLDPILDAYTNAKSAMNITRRCSEWTTINSASLFRFTEFEGADPLEVDAKFVEAGNEIADLTTLSLYATFERILRGHLIQFAHMLSPAGLPETLGAKLPVWFSDSMNWVKMDEIERWFSPPVSQTTRDKVTTIRTYRHWVAHGRDPIDARTAISPKNAHNFLSQFLQEAGLI